MFEAESMESTEVQSNGENLAKKEEPANDILSTAEVPPASNGGLSGDDQQAVKDEQMEPDKNYEDNEAYKMFMSKNLNKQVAENLIKMFEALELNTDEFDDRAVEMLATFPVDQANYIVRELRNSRLFGVQNKPQYLMSVMRNFRDRIRSMGPQQAMELPLIPGPDPDKIKELIDRTQYQLEVTVGQRKYYSPSGYEGPDPNQSGEGGCVYIGQIPKDVYEDTLVPLFEPLGTVYDFRIMMDPVLGKSRGYGFLIYCAKSAAIEAAKKFDGHEILPGKPLKVNVSVANTRLFLGNIPKSKSKDEILEELKKHTENIIDVIIYSNPDAHDGRKNRGFCFVDFSDHKTASDAKRRISMGKIRPWNTDLVVDWAEQQDEPDEEVMQRVKVLYVRNLKEAVTEEGLKAMFEVHGEVEKVKRIKDYAFIHFVERDAAVKALDALNKTEVEGVEIEVSLAKPQADPNQKKKLGIKRFPQPMYGDYQTPGLGSRGGRGSYGGYNPMGRGRGGMGPGQRSGFQQGYPSAYPQAPVGAYGGSYDPYYSAYGAGYGAGYDMYGAAAAGYGAADYYAQPAIQYGAGPSMRGGTSGYGFGTIARGRGGKASGGPGAMGRGGVGAKRGGMGRGGSKRAGGDFGGPASKRGGRTEDFSADVSMNMF